MMLLGIAWISCLVLFLTGIDGESETENEVIDTSRVSLSIDEWFERLNIELKSLNKLTAEFAWNLSLSSTKELSERSINFNTFRTQWINQRCNEIDPVTTNLNETQQLMVQMMCDGPHFFPEQTNELMQILYKMQEIFTETQICLPINFDVCVNLDRIWEFTYIKDPTGQMKPLDLSDFSTKSHPIKSKLNYFNGNLSATYYALSGNIQDNSTPNSIENQVRSGSFLCFDGEPDLDRFMAGDFSGFQRSDCALRFNDIFHWTWESWRSAVGLQIGSIYPLAVNLMNDGARNNGYNDIGEIWRDEMQLPNIDKVMSRLMLEIGSFYKLLHGVLRHVLWKRLHQFELFRKDGTMPAHLLGSMWAQNWELYNNLIIPFPEVNLEENLKKTNWTTLNMIQHADDFISSMGLPMMTKEFWKNSHFNKDDSLQKCHGTAANMYKKNDYRMIVCAERTFNDLYVIIHEMGHIQYYMAFKDQPTIFQDANTALQESIGDALYMGFMTPQHLNRVKLLPDQYLFPGTLKRLDQSLLNSIFSDGATTKNFEYFQFFADNSERNSHQSTVFLFDKPFPNASEKIEKMEKFQTFKDRSDRSINSFDLSLLLRMALSKVPQIPFEYILDIFRWDLFSGKISMSDANNYFWKLASDWQGIHAPNLKDRSQYFDPGAKFHVADNTPFVRYFLASFIQAQIFRGLCEITVYGNVSVGRELPMPLHRCDIYGSKRAGKLLKKALKLGQSQPWTDVLFILTGTREISADALLLYYQPLIRWLEKISIEYDIPIGW